MNDITRRVLKKLNDPDILAKLSALSPSDLNSLLLELYKTQAEGRSPADVISKYMSNRFVRPSAVNPAAYRRFEADLLTQAEEQGIEGMLLSPAALLGCCSAFGYVDQNNIISAVRGTEVLSDPTNMLAVILADRVKRKAMDNYHPVHCCASCRVTRAALFTGKRSFPHFGIFSIVSSGKDQGSYICEKEMLLKQLSFYKSVFAARPGSGISVVLEKRGGYADDEGFFSRMAALVAAEFPDVPVTLDRKHTGNSYYQGINFKIFTHVDDEAINIGDGGFVDWTQKLLGNKKERCLISGIGLDRLLMI